jgi:hypothetical protein
MAEISLIDLEDVGKALKHAADALKKFADSIAHVVRLGDRAWNQVLARRMTTRITNIYKISDQLRRQQRYAFDMVAEAVTYTQERLNKLEGLPDKQYRDHLIERDRSDWEDALSSLDGVLVQVYGLLDDLEKENSRFVLDEAYKALRDSVEARKILLARIAQARPPYSAGEIASLQSAVVEWKRLHAELERANELILEFLKSTPQPERRAVRKS